MKDDRVYLHHILRCIARIEEYVSAGSDAFSSSYLVQDAVIRSLQTMVESTRRLSPALKAQRPEADERPWLASETCLSTRISV